MTVPSGRALATRFDREDQSTGLALWRVTNAWQAAIRLALKPFGITHVQFVLLASLTWLQSEKPVTQQQLAGHARIDPMMTSQVLRALEGAGLVARHRHPSDGRARLVAVTAAGRELVNRAMVAVEDCDDRFFGPLGARRSEFTAMLGTL